MGRASIGFDKNSKADLKTFQMLMTVHRKRGTFFFKRINRHATDATKHYLIENKRSLGTKLTQDKSEDVFERVELRNKSKKSRK